MIGPAGDSYLQAVVVRLIDVRKDHIKLFVWQARIAALPESDRRGARYRIRPLELFRGRARVVAGGTEGSSRGRRSVDALGKLAEPDRLSASRPRASSGGGPRPSRAHRRLIKVQQTQQLRPMRAHVSDIQRYFGSDSPLYIQ